LPLQAPAAIAAGACVLASDFLHVKCKNDLDGGMSGQLAARAADGSITRRRNWRPVPLALLVRPR